MEAPSLPHRAAVVAFHARILIRTSYFIGKTRKQRTSLLVPDPSLLRSHKIIHIPVPHALGQRAASRIWSGSFNYLSPLQKPVGDLLGPPMKRQISARET
jgi:hypothetical protein